MTKGNAFRYRMIYWHGQAYFEAQVLSTLQGSRITKVSAAASKDLATSLAMITILTDEVAKLVEIRRKSAVAKSNQLCL